MAESDRRGLDITELGENARNLPRRDFIQFAVAAGMTVVGASSLLVSNLSASTPKRGGTFRLGIHDGSTSDSLDPGAYASFCMILLARTHRSFLTMIDASDQLRGDMATEWEPMIDQKGKRDASIWRFRLNKYASFHNGKSFTTSDAIASLNHHRKSDSKSSARTLVSQIKDVRPSGPNEIIFRLTEKNADFPWLLANYHLPMCPSNGYGEIDWQSGIGAGPYDIRDWQPGVKCKLVRHQNWHLDGAYFDEVELIVLNDPTARVNALLTGDVDAITQVAPKHALRLRQRDSVRVINVTSGAAITMPMFTDESPFNDVDVRNAMKYAINRSEIIDKIAYGMASIGNDFHLSPAMPYWPSDIPQRQYDPDAAKYLLKKAGLNNLRVDLSVSDVVFPGAVDMAMLYSQHAKSAGIDLTVTREPNDGYWSNVWLKKPFSVARWGQRMTPDQIFTLAYKGDASWNESHWENKQFNELLLLARAEFDDLKRSEIYREMCLLAKDYGGTIIPMFQDHVFAYSKKLNHGPELSGADTFDGARGCHRWWFS